MDLQLGGKNAVVLGGTRGIGRALSSTLADEGANVALCARNGDQVAGIVQDLKSKGVQAVGASVDITQDDDLTTWIQSIGNEFGGIDILISNAGAMAHGNDPNAWKDNFELDILGAVNAFNAAKPFLHKSAEQKGDAAFVIISSVSAVVADYADSYGPIKAALIHLAKGLAREHAKIGIRTNVVSPGMVYFEGGIWHDRELENPDMFSKALSRNPTGRCATPQEIADAAVFLASPRSSYTTGSNLIIDGAITNRVNF